MAGFVHVKVDVIFTQVIRPDVLRAAQLVGRDATIHSEHQATVFVAVVGRRIPSKVRYGRVCPLHSVAVPLESWVTKERKLKKKKKKRRRENGGVECSLFFSWHVYQPYFKSSSHQNLRRKRQIVSLFLLGCVLLWLQFCFCRPLKYSCCRKSFKE